MNQQVSVLVVEDFQLLNVKRWVPDAGIIQDEPFFRYGDCHISGCTLGTLMVKSRYMASQLTLDTKDPDVKAMVDGWADNREYTITLTVRSGAGNSRNVCEVLDVEEESAEEVEAPEEESVPSSIGSGAVKDAMESKMGGVTATE